MKKKESFDEYYEKIWGDRWQKLKESLLSQGKPCLFSNSLIKPYQMDRASILAAESLRIPESGLILDACAAPGGKSLVLASRMNSDVKLLCNELSSERRRRLVKVLDEYLEKEKRCQVSVSGFDAAKAGGKESEQQRFNAILLDAPCSSERHVINSKNALAVWTSARPRFLSSRQWALLSAVFLMLKPGGSLVYSTCAITPEENDVPVSRLLMKYKNEVQLDRPDFCEGENTDYGRIILPDQKDGETGEYCSLGPMYIARFRKKG